MIINMVGGGGASLNFDVKAYATNESLLAAAPKENTIGIITTTAISSWIFSVTQPAEAAEGMVWISLGTSSEVEFNALKKNALQVYPMAASQYVGGVWGKVMAYSYQGGLWETWPEKLFWIENGIVNETFSQRQESGTESWYKFESDGCVTVSVPNDSSTWMRSSGKPDVTNHSSLVLVCKGQTSGTVTVCLSTHSALSTVVASAEKITAGEGTLVVDVSALSGQYYFGVKCAAGASKATIKFSDVYLI